MVEASGEEIRMLLPSTLYVPAYKLHPEDPLILPSDVNSAVIPEPGTSSFPMKVDRLQIVPVRSCWPACWAAIPPQPDRTNNPAKRPTIKKIFFIELSFCI